MVFLVGVWAMLNRWYERLLETDWQSWLPFWRQGKRLERLIAKADANPKDAAKQSALLAEINKYRVMGAAAPQKYIASLGCIGASSSSSSYASKDLNREVLPEKDVKGCDDVKQELEEVVEYIRNPRILTCLGGKLPKGRCWRSWRTFVFYRAGSEFKEMFAGLEPSVLDPYSKQQRKRLLVLFHILQAP